VKEDSYFSGRRQLVDSLRADVRFGLRSVYRAPWMTLVAICVLAIGLGATVTMYSAIAGVVLRPLPFTQPAELVEVGVSSAAQSSLRMGASVADFADWQRMTNAFSDMAAFRPWGYELDGGAEPERVTGARVTANLFSLLGVRTIRGRTFIQGEDQPGANPVVVLSDSVWRRVYGADNRVVGKTIRLNGAAYTVIGVVDAGAMYPRASLWVPFVFAPYELAQRGDRPLSVVGRLKPGTTLRRARAELDGVVRVLASRYPDADAGWNAVVTPLHEMLIGNSRQTLMLLFIATCSLLIVACFNLANGLVAQLMTRRGELTIRAAIGASRARLIQQLVTESVLLTGTGGLGSLLVAIAGIRWLRALGPAYLPRMSDIGLDPAMFIGALGLIVATIVTLSMLIALVTTRIDLATALRSRDAPRRRKGASARDVFVVSQVAIALVLMIDGSLLVTSLRRIQSVPLGFSPEALVTATVSLPSGRYGEPERRVAFFDEVMARARTLPGVDDAALANRIAFAPSATGGIVNTIQRVGAGTTDAPDTPRGSVMVVSPSYFETLRIRTLVGRRFSAEDRATSPRVVIVDETLANRLSVSGPVIGSQVHLGGGTNGDTAAATIVGVVNATRMTDLAQPPQPLIYLPYAQSPWPTMNVIVRTPNAAVSAARDNLRRAIHAVDNGRPVYNLRALEAGIDDSLASRRLQSLLLTGFAVSALLLALLGVYSILAFSVRQRDREFGVRLAIGASRRQIAEGVLRESLSRIAMGVAIGLLLAFASGAALRGILFDLSPWHYPTIVGAAVALVVAGTVASYLPARRAGNVDPIVALRGE
jgi:putative ABC transport system permease protein